MAAEKDQFTLDLTTEDEDQNTPPSEAAEPPPAPSPQFPQMLSPMRHQDEMELPDEEYQEEAYAAPARVSTHPRPVSQQAPAATKKVEEKKAAHQEAKNIDKAQAHKDDEKKLSKDEEKIVEDNNTSGGVGKKRKSSYTGRQDSSGLGERNTVSGSLSRAATLPKTGQDRTVEASPPSRPPLHELHRNGGLLRSVPELQDPLFAITRCKGFGINYRHNVRWFQNVTARDKIGRDGPDHILVQKMFSRSEDTSAWKETYDDSTYKGYAVFVTLSSIPVISPGQGVGYYDLGQGSPGGRGMGRGRGGPPYNHYHY